MATAKQSDLPGLLGKTFLSSAEHYAQIGSTNDRAKELAAKEHTSLPCLVWADKQTAGRGRGANRWWTGEGSLAFSLLFNAAAAGIERQHNGLVSLACAAALVKTLRPLAPEVAVGLHWPNDVYAGNRKLAGILVESAPHGRLIAGIGLNVNNSHAAAPPELRDLAVALCDLTGHEHDRTNLLIELLKQIQRELKTLASDPQSIGRQADELCQQRGQWLLIDTGLETIGGTCEGIEPDGALLLLTDAGPRTFYAGVLRRA